jgi:signal transduction histidine kinase
VVAFGSIAVVVVAALFWTSHSMGKATSTAIRDTQSMAIASELEVSLLMHQRVSNLFVVSGEERLVSMRDDLARDMRRQVSLAEEYASGERETRLLSEIEDLLDVYLAHRESTEVDQQDVQAVIEQTRPVVNETIQLIETLRRLNEEQVEAVYERTNDVDLLADIVGVAAVMFIVAGFLGVLIATRTYLVSPLLGLYESLVELRRGATDVRAPETGPEETAEIGRAFNEMVASLQTQREAQIAFLAGVAHDLKNPLNGLKLGMRTLEIEMSPARRERMLEMLSRQVDRLARMVDDLLDTTRIEAGQLELRREVLDLRDAIDDVVQLYGPTSPDHRFVVDVPEHPIEIEGDVLRLEQVLGNLVSNAIKFSPKGSQIDLSLAVQDGEAVVSVKDRGVGIKPDELRNLFLPFRRATPDHAPGAGLGLSVVRRIVDAHGGTINVDSEPGSGSTFSIHLPRKRDPTRLRSDSEAASPDDRNPERSEMG